VSSNESRASSASRNRSRPSRRFLRVPQDRLHAASGPPTAEARTLAAGGGRAPRRWDHEKKRRARGGVGGAVGVGDRG
jgi:hypothetical protein